MKGAAAGRVLITGAGQRLGRAVAAALAEDGHDLVLHYNRSAEEAEALAEACRARGPRVATLAADLSDPDAAAALPGRAADALGPVTTLINNASIYERDRLSDFTAAGWERNMAINLRAPALLCQGFLRQLPDGARGCIVNFLDTRVAAPTAGNYLSYTVSKCALAALTRMLAPELAPRIRVNAVAPGLTLPSGGQTQAQFEAAQARAPLGRGAGVEDIVRAVRYLIAAEAVTGETLHVDGGERFHGRPLDA